MQRFKVGALATIGAAVGGLGVLLVFSAQGGDPPTPVNLVGISGDEVLTRDAGLTDLVFSVPDTENATLTAAEAEAASAKEFRGTKSRQTVLAEMRQPDVDGTRLVWVVNVEPDSLRGGSYASPNQIFLMWLTVFDANSGEFLFARSSYVDCVETPDDARCVELGLPVFPGSALGLDE